MTTVANVQHRNAKPAFTTWNTSTRKQKNRNNTVGQGQNICPFFEEVDEVLGTKPRIAPKLILEASGEYSHCLDCEAVNDVFITDSSTKAQKAATPVADIEPDKDEFSLTMALRHQAAATDPYAAGK